MTSVFDSLSLAFFRNPVFEAPKKQTIIRLRWMVVLASCYLLIFPREALLPSNLIHAFALFYILSNTVLYRFDRERFKSFSFFSTLVIVDTLALSFSLIITGQLGSDFYLTYFLIIIIAGFWRDFRWSLGFAVLISILYAYLLFIAENPSTHMFLRVPFLFIASVFYGYFAQVISTERLLRERAEQEARKDFLTGLPNRKAFEERIREETERARRYERPLSVLMIDIDNFKVINDSLGHQWGDVMLQKVAKLLIDSLRRIDCVARFGGEEFVVILPETGPKGAIEVANRIRSEIKQSPFETPKGLLSVTVSIGISSSLVKDSSDYVQMSREADQALYLAKRRGKDRVETLADQSSPYPDLN